MHFAAFSNNLAKNCVRGQVKTWYKTGHSTSSLVCNNQRCLDASVSSPSQIFFEFIQNSKMFESFWVITFLVNIPRKIFSELLQIIHSWHILKTLFVVMITPAVTQPVFPSISMDTFSICNYSLHSRTKLIPNNF